MRLRGNLVRTLTVTTILGMTACGGGGGGSSYTPPTTGTTGTTNPTGYTPGVFQPESTYAAKCAAPRTGTDPYNNNKPYPDMAGTSTDENNWLRSWTNDLYLWYSEVVDKDPSMYSTADYFPLMKTTATTASGNPKDKFHFTYKTSVWDSLSQSNTDIGYGVQFELLQTTPPRKVIIAFIEPGSAAGAAPASLARGASVLQIDGVDAVNANDQTSINTLNAGLSPATAGETHTFVVQDQGATTQRTVTLTSASVTTKSVPLVQSIPVSATDKVGYLLFNNQLAQAEPELVTAINQLKSDGIKDLIVDIRYNGGGFLDVASELAYMIADPNMTAGQTFELIQFNAKHPTTDPVTGAAIIPTPFHTTTVLGGSYAAGQPLPNLGLQRVFVLTTGGTCSASESVMNSLQGVGIEVIQIGETTCGKPYGFYPADNCGTTYFSIQFQGVNARNFGNYPDGFSPSSTMTTSTGTSATFPGCAVDDDFTHELGDPNESLLFVALAYRQNPGCVKPPAGLSPGMTVKQLTRGRVSSQGGQLVRSPAREIRVLRTPAQ